MLEVQQLIMQITDGTYDQQRAAMKELAQHPNRVTAVEPLMRSFRKRGDAESRHHASGFAFTISMALGEIGGEAALEALLQLLQQIKVVEKEPLDEDCKVREVLGSGGRVCADIIKVGL